MDIPSDCGSLQFSSVAVQLQATIPLCDLVSYTLMMWVHRGAILPGLRCKLN